MQTMLRAFHHPLEAVVQMRQMPLAHCHITTLANGHELLNPLHSVPLPNLVSQYPMTLKTNTANGRHHGGKGGKPWRGTRSPPQLE